MLRRLRAALSRPVATPSPAPASNRRALVPLLLLACVLAPAATGTAHAASIALGVVSFDVFVPGDGDAAGVGAIDIFGLTGDPAAGGFALDPDFPSYTPVTLLDALLTLIVDGTEHVLHLGDIGPGLFDPAHALLFPDTASISSLTLSATLSTTMLTLAGGTLFLVDSPMLLLTMLPSSGGAFVPGLDAILISVSGGRPPAVPEPGVPALLAIGIAGVGYSTSRRRRSGG